MGYVDKASMALIRRGLVQSFVSMNAKIADISEADTNKHLITLIAMGLPANAKVILLGAKRISGTGALDVFPDEGTEATRVGDSANMYGKNFAIGVTDERLQYALTVANDDFDLYCLGYWTSGRTTT